MFILGLKWRGRRVASLALVSTLAVAAVGLALAPAAAAASCPYAPNFYAGATKNGSDQYGARGYIQSRNVGGVPNDGASFSDQAFHAITSGKGLEVGWYSGWGSDTQTYVTSPHAYVTLNGPNEIDGPGVGQTTDWYSTNWTGAQQDWVVRQNKGGTLIWSGSQISSNSGPGVIAGLGEVNFSGGIMHGEFQGNKPADSTVLERYDGSSWGDWVSITLCADSGYSSSGDKTDYTDSTP